MNHPTIHAVQRPSPSSPTNLAEAFAFYTDYNFRLTPVHQGAKDGYKKDWSKPDTNAATLTDFRADDNVGVLNGTQPMEGWFNHDIDIDANSDAARDIVKRLLPPTGWRYGRPSKPCSHANYVVARQLHTRRFSGVDGKVILELRGITKKKT